MNAHVSIADLAAARPVSIPWRAPAMCEWLERQTAGGASFSEIAADVQHQFGQMVTRSMVAGAVRREREGRGVDTRQFPAPASRESHSLRIGAGKARVIKERPPATPKPKRPAPSPKAPLQYRAKARVADTVAEAAAAIGLSDAPMKCVPLIDLKPEDCRFPVSEDDRGRHLFCGRIKRNWPRPNQGSYCEAHSRTAWTVDRTTLHEPVPPPARPDPVAVAWQPTPLDRLFQAQVTR
ncbi:GcrA family cell cycle regulator [Phreatobacter sp. HK31-P]